MWGVLALFNYVSFNLYSYLITFIINSVSILRASILYSAKVDINFIFQFLCYLKSFAVSGQCLSGIYAARGPVANDLPLRYELRSTCTDIKSFLAQNPL